MRKSIFVMLCFLLVFVLPGCKGTGISKEKVWPDDEPSNHGGKAIMETDSGYYYDFGEGMFVPDDSGGSRMLSDISKHRLRYFDKESGEAILLCTHPECEHLGDENCVATYKGIGVFNSVLYDGMIYTYGLEIDENIMSLNLYCTALDGTTVDKVATILETENTSGSEYYLFPELRHAEGFVIHRGYAFVPYFLKIGKASSGFKGGGLKKVDLRNGEVTSILEMERPTSLYPSNIQGAGDYVYADISGGAINKGTMRCPVSGNVLEPATEWEGYNIDVATEKYLFGYSGYYDEDGQLHPNVAVFDAEGNDLPDKTFNLMEASEYEIMMMSETNMRQMYFYKDILYYITGGKIYMYSVSEDNWGELLSTIDYEKNETDEYYRLKEFFITNDRIYRVVSCTDYPFFITYGADVNYPYEVWYCETEDAVSGKSNWQKAFEYLPGD